MLTSKSYQVHVVAIIIYTIIVTGECYWSFMVCQALCMQYLVYNKKEPWEVGTIKISIFEMVTLK